MTLLMVLLVAFLPPYNMRMRFSINRQHSKTRLRPTNGEVATPQTDRVHEDRLVNIQGQTPQWNREQITTPGSEQETNSQQQEQQGTQFDRTDTSTNRVEDQIDQREIEVRNDQLPVQPSKSRLVKRVEESCSQTPFSNEQTSHHWRILFEP